MPAPLRSSPVIRRGLHLLLALGVAAPGAKGGSPWTQIPLIGTIAAGQLPGTFAGALTAIRDRLDEAGVALRSRDFQLVAQAAQAGSSMASGLSDLADAAGSGVPAWDLRKVEAASGALWSQCVALRDAAERGDVAGADAAYAKARAILDRLSKLAPARYACPMRCQGDRTYPTATVCPDCGMNLKKISSDRFSVSVTPNAGAIAPGEPALLSTVIRDPSGTPVSRLEVVHEKILHLLMVSQDLSWYAHEHPELQADGSFTLPFSFPAPGEYVLFHDFTPKDWGQQVVPVKLRVDGTAPAPIALTLDSAKPKLVDGCTVSLDTGGPVVTGGETRLVYRLADANGPVVDLEPYLGAMGHLIIVSRDLKTFVHSHPLERAAPAGSGPAGPVVEFHARFDTPGVYKAWAQFQRHGRVLTVPFTFEVARGPDVVPQAGGASHGHPVPSR